MAACPAVSGEAVGASPTGSMPPMTLRTKIRMCSAPIKKIRKAAANWHAHISRPAAVLSHGALQKHRAPRTSGHFVAVGRHLGEQLQKLLLLQRGAGVAHPKGNQSFWEVSDSPYGSHY